MDREPGGRSATAVWDEPVERAVEAPSSCAVDGALPGMVAQPLDDSTQKLDARRLSAAHQAMAEARGTATAAPPQASDQRISPGATVALVLLSCVFAAGLVLGYTVTTGAPQHPVSNAKPAPSLTAPTPALPGSAPPSAAAGPAVPAAASPSPDRQLKAADGGAIGRKPRVRSARRSRAGSRTSSRTRVRLRAAPRKARRVASVRVAAPRSRATRTSARPVVVRKRTRAITVATRRIRPQSSRRRLPPTTWQGYDQRAQRVLDGLNRAYGDWGRFR